MTAPGRAAATYRIASDAVPHSTCDDCAEEAIPAVVDALDAAGWLHNPAYVAALEVVEHWGHRLMTTVGTDYVRASQELRAALDAVPAAETGSREE